MENGSGSGRGKNQRRRITAARSVLVVFGVATEVDGSVRQELDERVQQHDEDDGALNDDVMRDGGADVEPATDGRHPVEELQAHDAGEEQDQQIDAAHRRAVLDGDGPQGRRHDDERDQDFPHQ